MFLMAVLCANGVFEKDIILTSAAVLHPPTPRALIIVKQNMMIKVNRNKRNAFMDFTYSL